MIYYKNVFNKPIDFFGINDKKEQSKITLNPQDVILFNPKSKEENVLKEEHKSQIETFLHIGYIIDESYVIKKIVKKFNFVEAYEIPKIIKELEDKISELNAEINDLRAKNSILLEENNKVKELQEQNKKLLEQIASSASSNDKSQKN